MGAQISLRGNLGSDPKLAYTRSNEPYLQFSLYQSHWVKDGSDYVDKGGFWMDCVWFHAGAVVAAQELKKGMPVMVNGDMRLDSWTDSEGVQRQRFKVVAAALGLVFLPGKQRQTQAGGNHIGNITGSVIKGGIHQGQSAPQKPSAQGKTAQDQAAAQRQSQQTQNQPKAQPQPQTQNAGQDLEQDWGKHHSDIDDIGDFSDEVPF